MSVFITIFTTLGAAVFLPIIFFIVGLCLRLKVKDAIISGMTLGIGFVGMGMLINFMFGYMQQTMTQFNDLTGMGLKGIDLGWSPLAAISWGFVWGLLFLPIQIFINILMISLKKTKTLNLDLWNIWNKIFLAIIVISLLTAMGAEKYVAIPVAMVIGSIQIPFELMLGDAVQKTVFKVTKIPGITVPHCMGFFGAICWPIEFLLRKSKVLNKDFNAAALRKKIGIFADNGFIGLLIGFVIGLIAYWPVPGQPVQIYMALLIAIQTATALVLFPMVARLFMQALAPISTAVDGLMKRNLKVKNFILDLIDQ
ncbi:hypothetical protein SCLARK_001171 [Spiroplasma clarkii]|uniref:PTS transporter subunit IIC n=1 Tax=Spiroplasma clarkii TaxID=2139 RepID=UPI000B56B10E|nr:PTS transporter subunit IIC [Spiroplasma clarkii]ARU91729.1 hypothetical protein SCLARK_001171 [Spiroplasma clarkii]